MTIDESILSSSGKICPECGRKFTPTSQWAYKVFTKGELVYLCRYNCHRSAEKRFKNETRRVKELKSKKPSKEKLEEHLRAGAPIENIAKRYEASAQSVKIWIKAYGLEGIQGVKEPKGEPVLVEAPLGRSASPMTSGVGVTQGDSDMVQSSPTLAEIEQLHMGGPVQELPKVEMDPIAIIDMKLGQDPTRGIDPALGIDMSKVEDFCTKDTKISADEEFVYQYIEGCRDLKEDLPITESEPTPAPLKPFAEVWQNVTEDLAALKRSYVALAQQEFKDGLLEIVSYLVG